MDYEYHDGESGDAEEDALFKRLSDAFDSADPTHMGDRQAEELGIYDFDVYQFTVDGEAWTMVGINQAFNPYHFFLKGHYDLDGVQWFLYCQDLIHTEADDRYARANGDPHPDDQTTPEWAASMKMVEWLRDN